MAEGGGGESLAQVRKERDQLERNEKTYQQRIRQLEEELKGVVTQSQQLSQENRQLREQLDSKEGGSRQVEELRKELQELTAMVAKTTGEKQQLEFENESLQSRLSMLETQAGRPTNAADDQKVKAKQEELEKRVQELERDKQGLQDKLKAADSAHTEKLASVLYNQNNSVSQLTDLKNSNKSLERTVEKLQAENKELARSMEQKRSELDELMRAMKTETKGESELKEANQELEFARRKIEDITKELKQVKTKNEMLEKENDDTKGTLRLKESESKGLKANTDEKDTQIAELKRQTDSLKRNVKRLETDLEEARQLEKDTANMKARIRSLKTEIEDSLTANQKMKEERAESKLQAERANRELASTTEALTESRRLLKKLEGERETRGKLEEELKLCKERAAGLERSAQDVAARKEQWKKKMEEELKGRKQRELELERQTKDLNARNEQLKTKIRQLEKNHEEAVNSRTNLTDLETLSKKQAEENKRLRQALAEKTMEVARHEAERSSLVKRVDTLERHQRASDVDRRQLKGWVDNAQEMYASVPAPSQYAFHQHSQDDVNHPSGPSFSSNPHPARRQATHTHPYQGRREGTHTHPQGRREETHTQPYQGRRESTHTHPHQGRNEVSHTHPHQGRGEVVPTHPHQTRSGGGGVGRRKRTQRHLQQDRQNQLNRSWEDMNTHHLRHEHDESQRTTPGSLPVILDSRILPSSGPSPPGYFDLYKNKMKLLRERKW
ncbi:uncharacterized protein LOC143292082 [Babylonia areolata]|uniref:uncharacterized protein LOC143292082 n=1 Tax=Babylonia areolata TaxID=304850 RepID=UPI003FD307B3